MNEGKKQFSFRYTEEVEELFERGLILFKSENHTPKFSINQLIEICLKKAIDFFPEKIGQLENSIDKLQAQLKKAEQEKCTALKELNDIKELLSQRKEIDNKLNKFGL